MSTKICSFRVLAYAAVAAGPLIWAPSAEGSEKPAFNQSESIVVARRRDEPLSETPLAVTAFDSDEISKRSATDLSFIGSVVPNATFDVGTIGVASSAVPAVYIRGIGQDDYLGTTDPGVGVYLDEVYLGRMVGQNLSTVDVEQIEVLRGPQGTLYGRNTIGGAINVRLRKPNRSAGAMVRSIVGTDELFDVASRVDLPLSDGVLTAWSANLRTRGGFARSPNAPGIDFGDDHKIMLRGQMQLQPVDALKISISADWSQQREESEPVFVYGSEFANPNTLVGLYNALAPPLLGRAPITPADLVPLSRPNDINLTGPSRDDLDIWGVTASLNWQLSNVLQIRSITSFRKLKSQIANDQDSLPQLGALFELAIDQRQFSQEFQVQLGLDSSYITAGLYYFSERARDDVHLSVVPGLFAGLESLPGPLIPLAPIPTDPSGFPLFACPAVPQGFPCAGGIGNPINIALDQTIRLFGDIDVVSIAGFANVSHDISDSISIEAGARLTQEQKTFFAFQSKIESSLATGMPIYNLTPRSKRARWTRVTPQASITYRMNERLLFYASYRRGFRSGTFNGRANNELTFQSVQPEALDAYEAGLKGRFSNNRGTFSFAAFHNDYSNMQVRAVIPSLSGLNVFFVNAAQARISGIEAEFDFRLSSRLRLGGGLGIADTKLTKVLPLIEESTGIRTGNVLAKTPKYNGSLFAEYALSVALVSLTGRGEVTWRSGIFHDAANTTIPGVGDTRESGYAMINASIDFEARDRRIRVALAAKNLTNQRPFANLLANAGGLLAAYPTRGREFSLIVQTNF